MARFGRCIAASSAILLTLSSILIPVGELAAQDRLETALQDFEFVTGIVEADYAGFPTKTTGTKKAEYEARKEAARAAIVARPDLAIIEIRMLLGWFQDGHLGLAGPPSNVPLAETSRAEETSVMSRKINEEDAQTAFRNAPGSIAGLWSSADELYRLAIVPAKESPSDFEIVVVASQSANWMAGDIKAVIRSDTSATWWMGDRTPRAVKAFTSPDVINFAGLDVTLFRDSPTSVIDRDRIIPSSEFFLRQLSAQTLWLRIPDFASEHRSKIEMLLTENDALLRATPNLIIDLRNNSGGSDSSYHKLMSYLYTRPIYQIGAEFRNTARNIITLDTGLAGVELPPSTRQFVDDLLARMRASDNKWVGADERGFSVITYPEIMPFPKRVGILGAGAASSGDQFVIDARFSKKVTLFGGPTAGIIDFSNVVEAPLPSDASFVLRWPISRSLRLPEEPLDNVGVQPDVPFGPEISDPVGQTMELLELGSP